MLIVTDAAVTDAGRILRQADAEAERSSSRRISVLCIDAAPNAYLANELAERGGGLACYLTSDPRHEDITTALDDVLTNWDAPLLANVRLVIGRADVQPGGRRLVDCAGEDRPPSISAIFRPGQPDGSVDSVETGDGSLACQLETDRGMVVAATELLAETAQEGQPTHRLAAIKSLFGARRVNALEALSTARFDQEMLQHLLQRLGYGAAGTGVDALYAENRAAWTTDAVNELLVAESLRYGLASSVAGFVAVRKEAGDVVDQTVIVGNALPSGWSDQAMANAMPMYGAGLRSASLGMGGPVAAYSPSPTLGLVPDMSMGGVLPAGSPMGQGPSVTWHVLFDRAIRLENGFVVLFDNANDDTLIPDDVIIAGIQASVAQDALTRTHQWPRLRSNSLLAIRPSRVHVCV